MTRTISSWRSPRSIVPQFAKNDDDKVVIPATRFFDQMAVIGVIAFLMGTITFEEKSILLTQSKTTVQME